MSAAEKHDPVLLEIRDLLRQLVRQGGAASKELLTRNEAAALLGISRGQIGRLAARGLIRTVPGAGKREKIPREEVERIARDGLPQMPKRGRPRKAARRPSDDIMAIPIPIARSARGEG